MSVEVSDKLCAVCRVPLQVRTSYEYRGDPYAFIIGPGGKNQMTSESTTSCPQCGLQYVNGGGAAPAPEKPKKLRAWIVSDRIEEHSKIVFAEKRSEAIMQAIGEWSDTTYIEAHCRRAPQFDDGIPSDEVMVRDHGWWWECRICQGHVTSSDLEEGAGWVDGPDKDPVCSYCHNKEMKNA